MRLYNGTQLYGPRRLLASLPLARHKALQGLSWRQRITLMRVANESKLTRLGDEHYTNTFTPYFPSVAYDRFLAGTVGLATGTPVPLVTNFALTPRCPCNCWHCSFSHRAKKQELTLAEITRAIADVQELGTSVIGFTGGEPLLRDDLEAIIAAVDERSMPIFFTTGHGLTATRVRGLKDAGLKIPVISLDHHTAAVHDRGRRKSGVFAGALRAIELFKAEGFYVAVSFVPNRALVEDREDLWKTIEFFRSLGVNDLRLTSPILSGQLVSRPEELLTPEHRETIFEIQRHCTRTEGYPGVFAYDHFEGEHLYGCLAGYGYLFIDAQGNLCPCDFTMMSFGNLKSRPIADIWRETTAHFELPGPYCYANRSNDCIARKKPESWPLDGLATRELLREVPPFYEGRLPDFFRRMGLDLAKARARRNHEPPQGR